MSNHKDNPAEIYLIPDAEQGHLWCDDPAPGEGMNEEDATRYVRADLVPESNAVLADRIAELTRQNSALVSQLGAWKAVSGKHLEVASSCLEEKRRLLLKTFIAGCDAGQKYGSNPFERDRQFDYFMADLRQQAKGGE